jgi:chromosomal replication initiator protein
MEDAEIVAALQADLVARIGNARYDLWFASQARMSVAAGRLIVHAASPFVRDWLSRNFTDELAASAQAVGGPSFAVEFEVDGNPAPSVMIKALPTSSQKSGIAVTDTPARKSEPQTSHSSPTSANNSQPRPTCLSLSRFIVGPSNEYAFRCAELTAHGLQQASPILFCSETGFGKTHLLRAVQAEHRRRHPRSTAI